MNMLPEMDRKILFVDDEINVLKAMKRQFHRQFRVETALGGEEALEKIQNAGPFAVVVSDLQMEDMNGLDFLRRVRECSPDSICVILTGFGDLNVAVNAVNEGIIFRFLTKPCPPDTLIKTLNECLEQHRRLMAVAVYTYTTHVENGAPTHTERGDGCQVVSGYGPQDFMADSLLHLSMVVPEHRGMVRENILRLASKKEGSPIEFQIRRKDGAVRWLRDTAIPHCDANGEICRIEGLVEDITDQKTVEQALQQSEARYQRMVANLPGLVYQFTLCEDGAIKFLFLSDSCGDLFGLTPAQVMEDSNLLMQCLSSGDRGDFYNMIADSAQKLTPGEWRGCGIFGGEEKWFHALCRPERLLGGDVIWDGILMDITDYKRMEQEREQLARFPSEDPSPVMRVAANGVIVYANKASAPLLNRWDRKVGEPLPENLLGLIARIKGSGSHECIEVDCKDRIYSIVFASIGKADYVNLYARDITEAKRGENELIRANEILREHDRLKSEFVSTVSHELRTPLCIFKNILSNAMAGVMGKVSDKLYDSLKTADQNVDRLSRIVANFLDISKIEAGTMELAQAVLSAQAVVEDVVASMETLSQAKNIEIRLALCKDDLKIVADEDRLIQILTNLIGNAIKFIPVHGHIEVTVEPAGEEVRFAVKDNGPGLSEDEMSRIFDRFVQIHKISGPGEHGTGLGLPITKELVEMHGGRIWVESTVGEGCCFYFVLPKHGIGRMGTVMEEALAAGRKD
ncbi:MAG: response regulator [Phycisphaerae bacterium]|nr:response regulator [Phycisphaerae bacterium]